MSGKPMTSDADSTSFSRGKGREPLYILLIMGIFFVIYYPVLFVGKISDDFLLTRTISSWSDIWSEQGGWTFRYAGNFILWLDGAIWRENFAGRHLDSIILQLVNIWVGYLIARRLFEERGSAVLCTAIYAFHFGNVGSVAWPVDKWTLSAALFILTGFYFSLKYFADPTTWNLAGATVSLGLGLMTKENVVMLLPIVAFFQWTRGVDPKETWRDRRFRRYYLLLGSVLSIYLVYRFGVAGGVARRGFAPGGAYAVSLSRGLFGFPFYVSYGFMLFDYFEFFRLDPEAIRIFFKTCMTGPFPYAIFGVFAVIVFCAFIKGKKYLDRNSLFGIGWFVALIMTFVFWFDVRWLNPATFGVAVVFTALAERLGILRSLALLFCDRNSISGRKVGYALMVFLLILSLGFSSSRKIDRWVENGALVQQIIFQTKIEKPSITPNSMIIFLNLPDLINMTHVFRNGIEQALREEYRDPTLIVVYNSRISDGFVNPDKFPVFVEKYKSLAETSRKKGGEVTTLFFDQADRKVKSFPSGNI